MYKVHLESMFARMPNHTELQFQGSQGSNTPFEQHMGDLQVEWRSLEDKVGDGKLDPIGDRADVLITFFSSDSPSLKMHREKEPTVEDLLLVGWTDMKLLHVCTAAVLAKGLSLSHYFCATHFERNSALRVCTHTKSGPRHCRAPACLGPGHWSFGANKMECGNGLGSQLGGDESGRG